MPPRKRWSKTIVECGVTVRIYERRPGGKLQIATWVPGSGSSRQSLKHRDREKAEEEGRAAARLHFGAPTPPPLKRADKPEPATLPVTTDRSPATLGELFEGYIEHATHTRTGCLITDGYADDLRWRAIALLRWFGHDTQTDALTRMRLDTYVRARRRGDVSGRAVRTRSVEADLKFLKFAIDWACGSTDPQIPLVHKNIFSEFHIPEEANPRRPFITDEDVDALMEVADLIHPLFKLLLVLCGWTGRRLSSVLGLTWADIQFQRRKIKWRAELDKKRAGWLGPLPTVVADALEEHRARSGSRAGDLVFQSSHDPKVPISRHTAADWLKRAYRMTGIDKEPGSLWHALRRKWGHDRQDCPVLETMHAGGWKDYGTFRRCYQYPDSDTMQAVADLAPIPDRRTQKRAHILELVENENGAASGNRSSAVS